MFLIAVMTIPIRLLWNLQISRIEKICVGFAFSVGIITMLFAIIRVISLDTTSGSSTHEVNTTWLILWAGVEGFVGKCTLSSAYPNSQII